MMKNKVLKISLILVIFLILIGISNPVNADMGPKPSITVKLTNMNTTDYLIDLLVYDETGENYLDEPNYNGNGLSSEEIELLHSINYDGWISEGTRWDSYLLFADCNGNSDFEHYFSYFGTPETYKVVIVNNKNGEIRVSDIINRTEFQSNITINVKDMKVKETTKQNQIFETIKRYSTPLIITIAVELFLSLLFINKQKRNLLVIFITNFVTNLLLQIVVEKVYNYYNYFLIFVMLEIVVILVEIIMYIKNIKDTGKLDIFLYTIVSNITTAYLTYYFPILMLTLENYI